MIASKYSHEAWAGTGEVLLFGLAILLVLTFAMASLSNAYLVAIAIIVATGIAYIAIKIRES